MDLTYLGKKIRDRRKELGMTQKELAKFANLSHTGIGKIESGSSDIKFTTLIKILNFLNLNLKIENINE